MAVSVAFDVCSLLIAVSVLSVNIHRKSFDLLQNKVFTWLSLTVIISSAARIVSDFALASPGSFSVDYMRIWSYIALLAQCVMFFMFAVYCLSVYDISILGPQLKNKAVLFVPAAMELMFFPVAYANDLIFRFTGSSERISVPAGTAVSIAFSIYFLIYGLVNCLLFKRTIEKKVLCSLFTFALLAEVGIVSEFLTPEILSPNLFTAFGLLFIQLLTNRTEDYIDAVTEIPNDRAFRKFFEVNLKTAQYSSVYVIYVENTRLLNLTIGHAKVNEILKKVGSYFEDITNKNVFYIDNGTYAIFPRLTPSSKDVFFGSVNKRFGMPWDVDGADFLISIKILEIKIPKDADSCDKIYAYADYLKSEKTSSGQLEYASHAQLKDNSRTLIVENCIKKAIENDGFCMYYQPIYSVKEKKIVSAEALIRLIDPEYGLISPAEFIPIAERNGSIIQIGKCVLRMVFDFMKRYNIEDLGLNYIEVNLSVIQCMQKNLADIIMSLAVDNNVNSKNINLEITETAAAERPVMLMHNMQLLVDNEYTFSLDDFGTGYSNISSMVDMPLMIIKFDKSIIDRATETDEGRILIESLAAMVKKMGKKIVAEGIETKEQLDAMEKIGIDYIQGYYFSKPIPESEFIEYVKNFNDLPAAQVVS
ncbi:MAG: EAL domain-containing protein [Oscillospiraceae bacterium]